MFWFTLALRKASPAECARVSAAADASDAASLLFRKKKHKKKNTAWGKAMQTRIGRVQTVPAPAPAPAAALAPAPEPAAALAPLPTTWRVLVADDHHINRVLMRRKALRVCGTWAVDVAETGEAALALAGRQRYDLVMLDERYGLTCARGTEITRRLRALERERAWPRAIILGMTGSKSAEHDLAGKRAGQDIVYGKPYPTPPQLAAELWALVQARAAAGGGEGGAEG